MAKIFVALPMLDLGSLPENHCQVVYSDLFHCGSGGRQCSFISQSITFSVYMRLNFYAAISMGLCLLLYQ